MNKVYVNRLVDSEYPNDNEYTYMYVTKKDCSELIDDCVNFYYNFMYEEENTNNLEYLIDEYNIDNVELIEYLKHNLQYFDTDNGVIILKAVSAVNGIGEIKHNIREVITRKESGKAELGPCFEILVIFGCSSSRKKYAVYEHKRKNRNKQEYAKYFCKLFQHNYSS